MTTPVDGWYPNPENPATERWWYRGSWTDMVRPKSRQATLQPPHLPPPLPPPDGGASPPHGQWRIGTPLGLGLAVVGALMQLQSVTVASGAGALWIGAALAAVGVVLAFALDADTAVKVIACILAALCVINCLSVEHSLSQKRQEIQDILNN